MPHTLTYDTQPPHSRVRREVVDGVLRLTAAPEGPGPMVRRAALMRSAIPAALVCGTVLLICLATFGGLYLTNRRGFSSELMAVLFIAFTVFCIALFGFIWRAHYFAQLDAARNALRQTTLVAASSNRLIVETAGPLGTRSHDLRDVVSIQPFRDRLDIIRSDGSRLPLFEGRDIAERQWIARAVAEALGIEPPVERR